MSIEEKICRCLRCGHEWVRRVGHQPVKCPECISPYWNVAKGVLRPGRPPGAVKKMVKRKASR